MSCSLCGTKAHLEHLSFLIKGEFGLSLRYCPVCGSDIVMETWLDELRERFHREYYELIRDKTEKIEDCAKPENPYYSPTPEEYLASIDIKRDLEIMTKTKEKEEVI